MKKERVCEEQKASLDKEIWIPPFYAILDELYRTVVLQRVPFPRQSTTVTTNVIRPKLNEFISKINKFEII